MNEQTTGTRWGLDARPLGVRPEVPLTEAQWAALQRLEDYVLAPVRARLLNTPLTREYRASWRFYQ